MFRRTLWILILPFFLYYLGAGLNLLVITVNHGLMPVYMSAAWYVLGAVPDTYPLLDEVHVAVTNYMHFHLLFLCDWIQVPWLGVVSPGDCLLWLGEWIQPYAFGAWLGITWMAE